MWSPEEATPVVEPVQVHGDRRGRLAKLFPWAVPGEVYLVSINPGASRGHHLHRETWECFAGVSGQATLVLEHPDSERREISLEGCRVLVPPGWAHAIFCPSSAMEPAVVAAAAGAAHDPDDALPAPLAPPQRLP